MRTARNRTWAAAMLVVLVMAGCTGGINAGEDGGIAFIVFGGMLLVTSFILWLVLGRED